MRQLRACGNLNLPQTPTGTIFIQVTAAKELRQGQAKINHCLNSITGMESTAVVRFSNLFEVDSTHLDLNMAPDFPRVVKKNVKRNAEDTRK